MLTPKLWILGVLGVTWPGAIRAQDTTKHRLAHAPIQAVQGGVAVPSHAVVQFNAAALSRLVGQVPTAIQVQRASGAVEPTTGPLRLRPGDIAALRIVAPAVRPARDTLELPFRYLTLSSTGRDTGLLVVSVVRPTLQPSSDARSFAGSMSIILRDSLHPARVDTLLAPVRFSAMASTATVEPGDFSIGHINLPPSRVAVTTSTLDDWIRLRLSNSLNPEGVDIVIPVAHPIALEPVQNPIWGFGLQKTVVHVTLPMRAGSTRRSVRLRGGDMKPDVLTLSGGQTGSVTLQSSGVGTATLWAEADPYQSAPTPIRYSWPILFFLASLLGGVAGSEIAGAGARRRGGGRSRPAYFLGGVLTGVFVAIAFAVGLNLTGIEIAKQGGEAVVFVVAVLGALLGLPGIARAVPALGRALEGRS